MSIKQQLENLSNNKEGMSRKDFVLMAVSALGLFFISSLPSFMKSNQNKDAYGNNNYGGTKI